MANAKMLILLDAFTKKPCFKESFFYDEIGEGKVTVFSEDRFKEFASKNNITFKQIDSNNFLIKI